MSDDPGGGRSEGHSSQGMGRGNTSTAIVPVKHPHPSQERCSDSEVRQVMYDTIAVIVTAASCRFFYPRVVLGVHHPGCPYVSKGANGSALSTPVLSASTSHCCSDIRRGMRVSCTNLFLRSSASSDVSSSPSPVSPWKKAWFQHGGLSPCLTSISHFVAAHFTKLAVVSNNPAYLDTKNNTPRQHTPWTIFSSLHFSTTESAAMRRTSALEPSRRAFPKTYRLDYASSSRCGEVEL